MPELPEVQTVVSTLQNQLNHPTIQDIDIYWDNIINQPIDEFKKMLIGETIKNYRRKGKYILLECEHVMLIIHLRMEGKFYILDSSIPKDKHTHVVFHLDDGRELRYHDVRKFGKMRVEILRDDSEYISLKETGMDALDENLNAVYLYDAWHDKNTPIKGCLLDQHIICGIGNIYADEICFSCNLHPCTPASHLTIHDYENIVYHTRRILEGAIRSGGTTIRSYTSSLGVTGLFQLKLKVHQKANEPCPICGNKIMKIKVVQRGTYLCPQCQKIK